MLAEVEGVIDKAINDRKFDARPNTVIEFESEQLKENIIASPYSCIIGPNNSGKSFVLRI